MYELVIFVIIQNDWINNLSTFVLQFQLKNVIIRIIDIVNINLFLLY